MNEALSVAGQDPALQRHLAEIHNLPLGGDAKAFQHLIAIEREAARLAGRSRQAVIAPPGR